MKISRWTHFLHNIRWAILSCFFLLQLTGFTLAQTTADSILNLPPVPRVISADDPSQFLTRVEIFNEFQHYDKAGGFNLNQTVFRTIVKIGKRFTTRIDIPFVTNTFSYPQGFDKFGIGDISFRLLGYNIHQAKRSAVTASVEISLNTAATPAQGTGKNVIVPVLTYSTFLKDYKTLFALVFQQTNSFSGDETRADYNFSKLQALLLHYWNKQAWTVVAPELIVDYINGGTSMFLKGRMVYAPNPRTNLWIQANAGLYGDFVARYNWGGEVGCRYFLLRKSNAASAKKK